MQDKLKQHWNEKYKTTSQEKLGWYEETSSPSLELIQECGLSKSDSVLDIGSGSSTLIDSLIQEGYTSIIASDISEAALEITKARLGTLAAKVTFVVDDVLRPDKLDALEKVSLWHDRAVFHFLTDPNDQKTYIQKLNDYLQKDGFFLLATFALDGPKQCSELDIVQYDEKKISRLLSKNFKLIKTVTESHVKPNGGVQKFNYFLLQKQ